MTNDTQPRTFAPPTTEPRDATDRAPSDLFGALFGVGAAWARYGLSMGRASLSATAVTLDATSDLLGWLSRSLVDAAAQVRSRSEKDDTTT